ncbi:MAG: isoprenylcysteine carboxylmethyltransferase family protein [Thermoplasmata archaeon]|nr:MAG: isoprenylcysteine carboxylmethyltransferase family protein [Thermoplasmata archaeon]
MKKLIKIMKNKNFPFRTMLVILIIIPIFYFQDFYIHIYYHFSGTSLVNTITQQWHIVILNIALFLSFLIPLSFRRKINWKEYGLVTAFFVSLFIEMYGIPLTVFFASEYFAGSGSELPNIVFAFSFLGVDIGMTLAMIYGTLLMLIGMILIIIGWVTLYKNLKEDEIVTSGIYSYSRHPQYFGFILIVIGWLVGWPTILTVIFAPILVFMYVRVCKIEEKELSDIEEYKDYKKEVPFFI